VKKDSAQLAAEHLSDLHLATAIEVLCESSLFSTAEGRRFERRIRKLCRDECQRQLRGFDDARARL